MNPQNPKNPQHQWQEIDADVSPTQPFSPNPNPFSIAIALYQQAIGWISSLPKEGQIITVGIVLFVGVSAIATVLKLVSFVLSLALLGAFLYIGYRFIAARSEKPL
jgi:hypothetical protein